MSEEFNQKLYPEFYDLVITRRKGKGPCGTVKRRKCLRCQDVFNSKDSGTRFCGTCSRAISRKVNR